MIHVSRWSEEAAAVEGDHLTKLTDSAIAVMKLTRQVIHAMASSKSADAGTIAGVIGENLGVLIKVEDKLINKSLDFKNHGKAVADGLRLF